MKYFLLTLSLLVSSILAGQTNELPADFKLVYSNDAGMSPLRENLSFEGYKGQYNAFDNGNNFDIEFGNKKVAQQLHHQLSECGFYTLQWPTKDAPPKQIAKDEGKTTLKVTANGKSYFVARADIEDMDEANALIARKAFTILNKFGKQYRF